MAEKALVTFARNRIGYVIAKNLSQRGIDVIAADSISSAMTYYSRYVKGRAIYTDPHKSEQGFIDSIIAICKEHQISVVIPGHEESFVLSKYSDQLKKANILTAIPTYDQVQEANDKNRVTKLAEKLGIKVPKTYRFTSIRDFEKNVENIKRFPVVIKLTKTRGGVGFCKAYSTAELKQKYVETLQEFGITKGEDFPLVQDYIEGYGLGVSMLFDKGKAITSFSHKRIWEYPIEGGFSIERTGVHHELAEKETKRLLEALHWHGVAMVEYRVDAKTEEPYFLEINPRFWGSLNQAVVSGVDFPYMTYQIACGKKIKPSFEYRLGVKTKWAAGMLVALPSYLKTKHRFAFIKDCLALPSKNVHIDDFSLSDLRPFFMEFAKPLADMFSGKNLRAQDLKEVKSNYK